MGSWLRTPAGPAAYLPATVFGESISARGAAASASKPELPIPAARRRSATALSGAAGAKCAPAPGATRSASRKQRPASRPARLESTSFDPAGRSLAAARTVAAKRQWRSSEANRRPNAFSGARPASPATRTAATASGRPWAASIKGTGPEQTTASPWNSAGITNIPASNAATTASGTSASAAGTAKPGENTARQRTCTGIKAGPREGPRLERAARWGAQVSQTSVESYCHETERRSFARQECCRGVSFRSPDRLVRRIVHYR